MNERKSTASRWQSVAICATCWNERNPHREPFRTPEALRDAELCYLCNRTTSAGIFVRADLRDIWGGNR